MAPDTIRSIVAASPDGGQILVTLYESGEVDVATRSDPGEPWGPAYEIVSDERWPQ